MRCNLQTPEHQDGQSVALDEVMRASKLFHGLQPEEIAEIVALLQPVNCKRGERILERGIWQGQLYIIASGQVSVVLQEGVAGGGEEGEAFATPGGQDRPGRETRNRELSRTPTL